MCNPSSGEMDRLFFFAGDGWRASLGVPQADSRIASETRARRPVPSFVSLGKSSSAARPGRGRQQQRGRLLRHASWIPHVHVRVSGASIHKTEHTMFPQVLSLRVGRTTYTVTDIPDIAFVEVHVGRATATCLPACLQAAKRGKRSQGTDWSAVLTNNIVVSCHGHETSCKSRPS